MSQAATRLYGLIGFPLGHSLSPRMHNAAFAHLKLNAEYRLFELKEEELAPFIGSVASRGIDGLNVTVPYKEKVVPLLASISPEARLIGAVNTIQVRDGQCHGFNTDGSGFLQHLQQDLGFVVGSARIALLGAGGAARAVAVFLAKAGPRKLSLYDVDIQKSQALARHLAEHFPRLDCQVVNRVADLGIKEADLVVNATPVGMKPADPLLVDPADLHPGLLVYDLIYNPPQTSLLAEARARGCRFAHGAGMLLYQGMSAFEIWTGRPAPKEVMRLALAAGLA